ncbi:MAG: DUF1847 domain-containing protein [Chloroflexi bacterium]|nr:DUF1847 domain-containing protein [Chloroflexota bacterium]
MPEVDNSDSSEARLSPTCAQCGKDWAKKGKTSCWSGSIETVLQGPKNCPTKNYADIIAEARRITLEGPDTELYKAASRVEGLASRTPPGETEINMKWTRVEDTIVMAQMMDWKKIGIATCVGLLVESETLTRILEARGFEVVSACCKEGGVDKLSLGLTETEKVRMNTFEPACNPIGQALVLNEENTDMNIIMGLCVGHDMLFAKYSKAPVTTLVAKDRVTGHNPVAALYNAHFYFKRLLRPKSVTGGR